MKTTAVKTIWEVVLFSLAVLTLACIQGHVAFDRFLGWKSFTIFTGLSVLSFVSYTLPGVKKWAWLFPALVSAALALNAMGVFSRFGSPIVAFPILLSFAIPFYVGFLLDRKQWYWLLPAWILTLIAMIPALVPLVDENLLIALLLSSLSFPFLVGCISSSGRQLPQFGAAFFALTGLVCLVDSIVRGASQGLVLLLIMVISVAAILITGARAVAGIVVKMKVTRQLSP